MSLRYGKREPGVELPNYILPYIKWLQDQIKGTQRPVGHHDGQECRPRRRSPPRRVTLGQEASGVRFRDALADISGRCRR